MVDRIVMTDLENDGFVAVKESEQLAELRGMTQEQIASWYLANVTDLPAAIELLGQLAGLCLYLLHRVDGREHVIIDRLAPVIPLFDESIETQTDQSPEAGQLRRLVG